MQSGLAAAAVFTLSGVASAPSPLPSPTSDPWDQCYDNPALPYDRPLGIKMQALDAPDFDLLAYRGHPLLLNLFASWCGPCNEEMPQMVDLANDYFDRGLRVVGINYREPDDTVRAFRKKYKIPYPIAMDRNGRFTVAMQRGKTTGNIEFPTTLFISADGYLYCDVRDSMSRRELAYRVERFVKAK